MGADYFGVLTTVWADYCVGADYLGGSKPSGSRKA